MTPKQIEDDVGLIMYEIGVSHFADNAQFRDAAIRLITEAMIDLKRIADALDRKS